MLAAGKIPAGKGRPDVDEKDGQGDREVGSARNLTNVQHLARVDELGIDVERKLGILES